MVRVVSPATSAGKGQLPAISLAAPPELVAPELAAPPELVAPPETAALSVIAKRAAREQADAWSAKALSQMARRERITATPRRSGSGADWAGPRMQPFDPRSECQRQVQRAGHARLASRRIGKRARTPRPGWRRPGTTIGRPSAPLAVAPPGRRRLSEVRLEKVRREASPDAANSPGSRRPITRTAWRPPHCLPCSRRSVAFRSLQTSLAGSAGTRSPSSSAPWARWPVRRRRGWPAPQPRARSRNQIADFGRYWARRSAVWAWSRPDAAALLQSASRTDELEALHWRESPRL